MVDFNVNVLGGLDLGAAVGGAMDKRRLREQQEELKFERQRIKNLTVKAAGGDGEAINELFSTNPELAIGLEKRAFEKTQRLGAEQAKLSEEAETDWGLRWRQASTPEQFETLQQEALDNPLIDFDESDLSVTDSQKNLSVNTMLFRNMGKDAYTQFFDGGKPEKGVFTIKETPTGFVRLNTGTGQITEIPSDSVAAKNAKAKEKAAFDKELKASDTNFQRSKDIRSRYDKKTTEFSKVRDAYGRIQASVDEPSAAGDLSLIFNYMKMLDPGSVVRESEFATAAAAASVPQRLRGAYNRAVAGERMADAQRADFVSRAGKLMKSAENQQVKDKDEALRLGKQWGVSEADLFGQDEQAVNWDDL